MIPVHNVDVGNLFHIPFNSLLFLVSDCRNHFKGVPPPSALPTILGKFRLHLASPIWVSTLLYAPILFLRNGLIVTSQTQLLLHRLRLPTPFHLTRPSLKDFTQCYQPSTGSISPLRRGYRTSDAGIGFSQDSAHSHTIRSRFQRRRASAGRVFRPFILMLSVLARQ